VVLLGGLWLAGCRTAPPPPPPPPPPIPVPEVVPERIDHYRVDPQASQVLVLVYRDGAMARLGHNHVLSVQQLSGEVVVPKDLANSTFTLEFPVAAMSIDEPALRATLGDEFKAPVDSKSIEGTRGHMLGDKLLSAAHFPVIRLASGPLRSEQDHWIVTLNISVRDHASAIDVPVALTIAADQLDASGEFDLTHAQLGLTPYSIGMGALRVAEILHIRFHVVARYSGDSAGGAQSP
jgi:hypothetical protein